MQITPALEYEKHRQDVDSWNKIILHKDGTFYHAYEWSAWLIKTIVCTEKFQKDRGDEKVLSAPRYKTQIHEVRYGVEFLGGYVKPFRTYMSHAALRRLRHNIDKLPTNNRGQLFRSINAMLGVMDHFDSFKLRKLLFDVEPFTKHGYFDRDMTTFTLHKVNPSQRIA